MNISLGVKELKHTLIQFLSQIDNIYSLLGWFIPKSKFFLFSNKRYLYKFKYSSMLNGKLCE